MVARNLAADFLLEFMHTGVSLRARGLFLKGPEKFSHPKSHSKISNLMTIKLFYAYKKFQAYAPLCL